VILRTTNSTICARKIAALTGLYAVLTCGMLWPLVQHIVDRSVEHQDVYFNMWRLQWVAHALATSPRNLFNGNIFYPEPRTLLFSDAMLVQSTVAAPLIWIRLPPVLVHNIMLVGAIVTSALAMFALVRHVTGSRGAALLAGVIFAFAPYRFAHLMHMELQWTMWTPLAFLAMHRTIEHGRVRDGLLAGGAVVLQMLSSVYYGLFLMALLTVCAILLKLGENRALVRRALVPLTAGALLAVSIIGLYAVPYLHARERVGTRTAEEVQVFAARPADYLVTAQTNWLYGRLQAPSEPERRLFPGAGAFLLAVVAVLLRRPSRTVITYLLGAVVAFEASLGLRGYCYAFLYDHITAFHALRAPARLGMFVVFFLAVLAGFGYAHLASGLRARWRGALLAALVGAVMLEYVTSIAIVPYPNAAPPVYRLLATQPEGVVAEFPMPGINGLPGEDPKYEYLSIFHWKPLVNGYSGFYPPTYIRRVLDVRRFPEPFALRVLRRDGVRYVVVHEGGYVQDPTAYARVISALDDSKDLRNLGTFGDGEGKATVYSFY
jgi:Dolichyl-phosphate-mannose-protein mannosyltransferase